MVTSCLIQESKSDCSSRPYAKRAIKLFISPPRLDSSKGANRVNRAHWPTKENRHCFCMFYIFPDCAKNWPRWAQMGPGGFFPTNPDLANILGRTDVDSENFHVSCLVFQTSGFVVPRVPNSEKSGMGQV